MDSAKQQTVYREVALKKLLDWNFLSGCYENTENSEFYSKTIEGGLNYGQAACARNKIPVPADRREN